MKLKTDLLENQIKMAKSSVETLIKCIEAYYYNQKDQIKNLQKDIRVIIKEIEKIKEHAQLHWSTIEIDFRTKFAAMELIAKITLIADYAEDVAVLLVMREQSIPENIWLDFRSFVDTVLSTVTQLEAAILIARRMKAKVCKDCEHFVRMYPGASMGRCRKMDENKFVPGLREETSGCELEEKEEVYQACMEVNLVEEEADRLERRLRRKIYREEIGLQMMPAMHFLKLVENLDMIANTAEDCVNSLRAMY